MGEQVHTTPVTQETAEVNPKGSPIIDPIVQTSAPCQMRSGRIIKATASYHKSFSLVAWETLLDQDDKMVFPSSHRQFKIQKEMEHPIALAATTNPDILYIQEAMQHPDRLKFIEAMNLKLNKHEKRDNFVPIKKEDIPKEAS